MVLAAAIVPDGAAADPIDDVRQKREEVQRQRTVLATDIDVLRADDAQVRAALAALTASVSAESARLVDAQNALAASKEEVARARAVEQATGLRITVLEGELRRMAIAAYMGGAATDEIQITLSAGDPDEAVRRDAMIGMVVGDAADLADELAAAKEDQTVARRQAEEARAAAQRHQAEVERRLGDLQAARDQQAAFAAELDARIEARLAEAAALEQLDAQLAAELARQQEELARQARELARRTTSRSSSSASTPLAGGLTQVGGIVVASSIASELASLLAAAGADGIHLGGGGYRDPAAQRALRAQNCSDAASSPAGSCRPPTARPGHSMHERGLAIDFTYEGRAIQSHANPGYRWLAANAGRHGLYNLPSEPWHWSVNGS